MLMIIENYHFITVVRKSQITNRIFIEKPVHKSLTLPYNECLKMEEINSFNSRILEQIFKMGYSHRRVDCFDLCIEKYRFDSN